MAVSVLQFIEEHEEIFGSLRTFASIKRDLESNLQGGKSPATANDITAKLILSHQYDNYCDGRIAKAFREFAIRHTDFVGGSYEEAH